jgi:regulator of cell morphogenesis and NO signaling
MSRLVSENRNALLTLIRFDIALGFGDRTIEEICFDNQVDTDTFLAIIRLLSDPDCKHCQPETKISVPTLIRYLRNSHAYFLNERMPAMREKLLKVLDKREVGLNQAVTNYFDKFVAAIRKHMLYENNEVFPQLNNVNVTEKYAHVFSKQHSQIELYLTEFKNILIKYYPVQSSFSMHRFLFDICNCEQELIFHNAVEDELFLPAIA